MKSNILSAAIVALGIVVLGLCMKGGMDNFTEKDRKVTVKGLAEREVKADKVTWPIVSKELGNDLPELYDRIAAKQRIIKQFLMSNGVSASEISVDAPKVIDMSADQYSPTSRPTATTSQSTSRSPRSTSIASAPSSPDRVSLLKQGVAIVASDYNTQVSYSLDSFKKMKPAMMTEAIDNAQQTAEQFAKNSKSKINKIVSADQGQFSIDNRDDNTPWIKRVRVVTTVTYSLKD